jgi:hypothetical protein
MLAIVLLHFRLVNKPKKAVAIITTKIITPIDQGNTLGDLYDP